MTCKHRFFALAGFQLYSEASKTCMMHREQRKSWKSGGLVVKDDNEKSCDWVR